MMNSTEAGEASFTYDKEDTATVANEQEIMYSLILCDSGLGAGSIAHSQGLESAYQNGFVAQSQESLKRYIELVLHQSICQALPFVESSQAVGNRLSQQWGDRSEHWNHGMRTMMAIESHCSAVFAGSAVANRASISQGKCLLRVVKDAFVEHKHILRALYDEIDGTRLMGHYAPVFGLICGVLKMSRHLTPLLFLRSIVRDLVSSATRLSIVGPLEGARVQVEMINTTLNMLKANRVAEDDIVHNQQVETRYLESCQSSSILDILQSKHDILYTRLFNS